MAPADYAQCGRHRPTEPKYDDPELLKAFGITRLGDITDLDVIGMPVWFATRPNSRGLSVSQGKGLTHEQARRSAVMEAIEGAVAEDTQRHVSRFASIRSLIDDGIRTVPFDAVARVDLHNLDPARQRAWVEGFSVRSGERIVAPFELVGLDFRADFPWDRQAFMMSSQGLAAGFDFDRTALHAILELVENDACFMVDALGTQAAGRRPVKFSKMVSVELDALVERLANVGLTVSFFDLTGANAVPVILASIQRFVMADDGPGHRISAGVACRLDPWDAALAALQEAVQSRLTDISGSRDDLSPQRYRPDLSGTSCQTKEALPYDCKPQAIFGYQSGSPVWRHLANHLFSHGVDDIYLFSLAADHPEVVVVRAIAAGLKTADGKENALSLGALHSFLGA